MPQDGASNSAPLRGHFPSYQAEPVIGPADADIASALISGTSDPSALRNVERCTEASCGQRSVEASFLRRFHGMTGPDPPDRLELGQCSWALLHTSAAVFPMEPTGKQRQRMESWLDAFFKLYPCNECRTHIAPYVKNNPIETEDGARLSAWLCNSHNYVNRDLGKDLVVPCDGTAVSRLYATSRIVRRPDLS